MIIIFLSWVKFDIGATVTIFGTGFSEFDRSIKVNIGEDVHKPCQQTKPTIFLDNYCAHNVCTGTFLLSKSWSLQNVLILENKSGNSFSIVNNLRGLNFSIDCGVQLIIDRYRDL